MAELRLGAPAGRSKTWGESCSFWRLLTTPVAFICPLCTLKFFSAWCTCLHRDATWYLTGQ